MKLTVAKVVSFSNADTPRPLAPKSLGRVICVIAGSSMNALSPIVVIVTGNVFVVASNVPITLIEDNSVIPLNASFPINVKLDVLCP